MSAQNDSAFLRMFLFVLGGLLAFTIAIMYAANHIGGDAKPAGDKRLQAVIAERIAPVSSVEVTDPNAAPPAPKTGDVIVAETCSSCHGSGALGAPKIGDAAAWQARLDDNKGLDGLTASAIAGKGMMPPRGGAATLSDAEVHAAIAHMLEKSGIEVAADSGAADPAPAAEAPAPVAAAADAAGSMMDAMAGAVGKMADAVMPAAPAVDLAKGKSVYDGACFACHGSGAAGAPKLGDNAAWSDRIAAGMDSLVQHAIAGKGAMPPKGGRLDLSDDDVKAAVAYMVDQAK